jgi:predicted Rossmann fold nucleotide-binding protein DprA/Smf involved in DNA uptake
MSTAISLNTQAILLLTAPLIIGKRDQEYEYLTQWEYKKLARFLREIKKQPADLIGTEANDILVEIGNILDRQRINKLLGRGFLLSQAIDRWQTRALWVISRADEQYPRRLKERLKDDSPPVLYGCGDIPILDTGGLAVVGSRHVDDILIQYTQNIGRLVAKAKLTLVSGGARGIDQAAMRGALEGGGKVTGIMADSLERASLERSNRNLLMENQLVLVSPYDPSAGFNVGNAMQRNKLIYALSDAALVVSSDYNTGGTWAGATEQLNKLKLVPIFVRSTGSINKGLEQLRVLGAKPWPNPENPGELITVLKKDVINKTEDLIQPDIFSVSQDIAEPIIPLLVQVPCAPIPLVINNTAVQSPEADLTSKLMELMRASSKPMTLQEITEKLVIKKTQLAKSIQPLIEQGIVDKLRKPVRYCIHVEKQPSLFELKRVPKPRKSKKFAKKRDNISTESGLL